MKLRDRVDPELISSLELFEAVTGGGLNLEDIPATRALLRQITALQKANTPEIKGVSFEEKKIPGSDGDPDVIVHIFRPESPTKALPALLWMHGGGYVLGSVQEEELSAAKFAQDLDCVVVSVDYRLAPDFPFPAPLEDCYTALKWLSANCNTIGVEKSRIAIGGESAGGGLAASLAFLARDRGEVNIIFQLLLAPMIDDRNIKPASKNVSDTLLWSRNNNLIAWRSYLGCEPGSKDVPQYAVPSREPDLTNLPAGLIAVGDLDLFINENITYAQRLIAADVPTELHVYSGAVHAFSTLAPDAQVSRRFHSEMCSVVKRMLHT